MLEEIYKLQIFTYEDTLAYRHAKVINCAKFRKDEPIKTLENVLKGCKVVNGYVEHK